MNFLIFVQSSTAELLRNNYLCQHQHQYSHLCKTQLSKMATSSQWDRFTWSCLANNGRTEPSGTNQVEERIFAQSLQCSVNWWPDRTGQAMSGNVEMDVRGTVVDSGGNHTNHNYQDTQSTLLNTYHQPQIIFLNCTKLYARVIWELRGPRCGGLEIFPHNKRKSERIRFSKKYFFIHFYWVNKIHE